MINAETLGRSFKCSLKVRNEDDECIGDSVKVKYIKGAVSREVETLHTTSTVLKDSTVLYFRCFLAQKFYKVFAVSFYSSVKMKSSCSLLM
jgi:hypothetical protein